MLRALVAAKQSFVSRRRRGFGRAAAFLVVATALLASGCGHQGHGAATDSEKAADVEILNVVLAQELTTLNAYERALPLLRGPMLVAGREFRGQDQAHADALTKAIRGLGGETEAEASELESPPPRTRADALLLAYEAENAALAEALDAVPHLQATAPRGLAAALAADHAQHLTVLRQGLGAAPAASVPEPFESGDAPPPAAGTGAPEASE
jgi:bacterioferritin (cytochrome b1)